MEISAAIFDHTAHLARLSFSETEKEPLRREMQKMVSFFEKLNELDTTGTEPLVFVSGVIQATRPDVAAAGTERSKVLQNAPGSDGVFVRVPKVIQNPAS
jgi:aspartyl-tRNA(Asn)/glutamyl-tRNA(Gln) amidotransferase subunit C